METWLGHAVLFIFKQQQRRIDKNLFCFGLKDMMLGRVLLAVAIVPIEANNLGQINHFCILQQYTIACNPVLTAYGV